MESETRPELESWRQAIIVGAQAATTAAGLLNVVTFAEGLRPFLEAEVRLGQAFPDPPGGGASLT